MIVSTVAGRIRVRARRLHSAGFANRVRRQVETIPGVSSVRINAAAGCLVVAYDTQTVDTEWLEDRLEAICLPPAPVKVDKAPTLSKQINRATKAGMVTTLTTSLVYGFLGRKKPHIGFGAAFLAFAGIHMLRYRGTLLR